MINFSKTIEEFRTHVPVALSKSYLDSASTGLVPDFIYDGVHRYMNDRYLKGGDSSWEFPDETTGTLGMMSRAKQSIANMLHCDADRIAFGQSSTQMFTLVTEGIDFADDDNIVTVDKGWIGNRYAWQKKEDEGLEVRYVEPVDGAYTLRSITDLCDEHTRAVTVNFVESKTGYRVDIDELGSFCNRNDILLFVDAVQAAGVLQIDVQRSGIDFLVGNDYKWMMNFCGTGYAYISPEVQSLIRHWGAGWMSDSERFNTVKPRLTLREDAGRFEIGYPNAHGIYGLGLAAMQYEILGPEAIESYVMVLADYFRARVQSTPGMHLKYDFPERNLSQIVIIELEPGPAEISAKYLSESGINLQITDESGSRVVRFSFHYYNNQKDIDRFFNAISKYTTGPDRT